LNQIRVYFAGCGRNVFFRHGIFRNRSCRKGGLGEGLGLIIVSHEVVGEQRLGIGYSEMKRKEIGDSFAIILNAPQYLNFKKHYRRDFLWQAREGL
tara:strand:+ start:161 stop:448 length:288 start_codon:yes stop_codon:yes gene_type:complete